VHKLRHSETMMIRNNLICYVTIAFFVVVAESVEQTELVPESARLRHARVRARVRGVRVRVEVGGGVAALQTEESA
jgi:hypothetical protein